MKFTEIIRISRPRFWIYLAGPFVIGSTFATHDPAYYLTYGFWYQLLYFLIPANFFLYAVNDIYDEDVDTNNPKKHAIESRVTYHKKFVYRLAVLLSLISAIPMIFFVSQEALIWLILFFISGYCYSATPIRLKTRRVLDFSSNILYAFPGYMAYTSLTGNIPSIYVIMLTFLWTSAMHLFSAAVDIDADRQAHINTSATWLGYRKSVLTCITLWSVVTLYGMTLSPLFLFSIVYPVLCLLVLKNYIPLSDSYWLFPYINTISGFILFLYSIKSLY